MKPASLLGFCVHVSTMSDRERRDDICELTLDLSDSCYDIDVCMVGDINNDGCRDIQPYRFELLRL